MSVVHFSSHATPRNKSITSAGTTYCSDIRCAWKSAIKCCAVPEKKQLMQKYLNQIQSTRSMRMGLPSKGRMAEETLQLLHDCQLSVKKINPRQYAARIPEIPEIEVWFQRASDVVRKVRDGTFDFGTHYLQVFEISLLFRTIASRCCFK